MSILAYKERTINTKFIKRDSDTLIVLYPGFEYSLNAPLFYYLIKELKSSSFDILGIDYRYSEDSEYLKFPKEEQEKALYFDSHKISQYISENTRAYKRVVFIGKSLGTVFLLNQLKTGQIPRDSEIIWLTPAIDFNEFNYLENRNLLIYGILDPFYLKYKNVSIKNSIEKIEITKGKHCYEVDGDLESSINNNYLVIETIKKFIKN